MGRPCLSKQYKEENDSGDGVAKRWIEENDELVKLLSHTTRMVLAHEYARVLKAGEILKNEGLERLFQAWCGVALNEGMTGEGEMVHKDAKYHGMNCCTMLFLTFSALFAVLIELSALREAFSIQ
jgi:hypothetical protein